MYQRGNQDITWDAGNRPVSDSQNGTTAYFWYDGDGNRVKNVEGGQTVLYTNGDFKVNLSTSTNTFYYYLGGSLVAMSINSTLQYMHRDHVTGMSLVTSDNGTLLGTIKYTPFEWCL